MDEKYYTPTIEEIRVGLEIEVSYDITLKTLAVPHRNMEGWHKKIIKSEGTFSAYETLIGLKQIRIKYLDKEDIESFGFKLINNEDLYEKVIIDATTNYHNKIHLIKTLVDISIFQGDDETSFVDWACRSQQIKIKNKSELSKLLKQLNILT